MSCLSLSPVGWSHPQRPTCSDLLAKADSPTTLVQNISWDARLAW